MFEIKQLSGDEVRAAIDMRDRYKALLTLEHEHWHSFRGSMRYGERSGKDYLLRRTDRSDRSLGPRSDEMDQVLTRFETDKAALEQRIEGLRGEIQGRSRILVARGLGRVPTLAARILRRLDKVGWMGEGLVVVGTNALFAYEALAGVVLTSDALATEDVDILFDARRKVSLGRLESKARGLVGVLQSVDPSFAPMARGSFRAVNKTGFMVDLIEPLQRDPLRQPVRSLTGEDGDLAGVAIKGLGWLVNAPKCEAIVFDEAGLPARMVTVDPRVFALHKLWLSQQPDREPIKRRRDALQSHLAAQIAIQYLGLDFAGDDLSALPLALRQGAETLKIVPPAAGLW